MNEKRLKEIEERIRAATPLEDTGHSQTCRCEACKACWSHGAHVSYNALQLAKIDAPELIAEVRRLQSKAP